MTKLPIHSNTALKRRALKGIAACACLALLSSLAFGGSQDADRLARLEFNGFVTLGRGPAFNLSDPVGGWTAWVGLDGVSAGVTVVEFDREARLLTVAMGEETRQIRLKAEKILSMAIPGLSRGEASSAQEAAGELEKLEHERNIANEVGFDMALNHMVRQQRERDRLRARAMKAQAAATGD